MGYGGGLCFSTHMGSMQMYRYISVVTPSVTKWFAYRAICCKHRVKGRDYGGHFSVGRRQCLADTADFGQAGIGEFIRGQACVKIGRFTEVKLLDSRRIVPSDSWNPLHW